MALLDVGVMFAAVAVAGWLANRLGQSVIPAYILVGMLVGEFVLGRVALPAVGTVYVPETEFIALGAELGIVFLLFFLGLEFNLDRLLGRWRPIGTAGTIDLANFGVGLVLGWLVFDAFLPAFLVAGIVYISSSAVITKSLIDLGWIANDEAEPLLGTLVYEDLFIAVYLAVASALVLGGGDVAAAATDVGIAVGFIVGLLGVVRFGAPLFDRLVATDNREFVALRAVAAVVFVAGAALALGVSEAVAAFFVGMAFSATDRAHAIETILEPVRDLFAAVFFFWIGLVTDPALFADVAVFVALAVVVTTPTKVVTGYLAGRAFDLDVRRSTRVGLGMTTRGEFSLIIATVAVTGAEAGSFDPALAGTINAFAVGYVLVMAVLGTTLMGYSAPFESIATSWLDRGGADGSGAGG
ncbi:MULTISPECIES: cation:proton antiporter [Halorubrum]|uniref:Monovalent cation:H+ antiporter-2, CPA2 family n=1 Tax=Halorubrum sodomense TaxID=35743 RepID=A0A1I6FUS1_HALSD|nr:MULTISPECIES: cation:proton antiporter [Halorubrum]TKX53451.1 cation:proton antiporter [Halorubrum sp. SP3]TKX69555.1 cation:proton antiporter [Halorubrum sp. SP9]SFR33673.1 monovalent cation:H+ antiporter-2, CPA2 family [Halorubrum sodomense]